MTKRRAIIHIGAPFVGGSPISRFLRENRVALRKQGFYFPASPGQPAHRRLVLFAANFLPGMPFARNVIANFAMPPYADPAEQEAARREFQDDFRAEMASMPESMHTVLLCAEQFMFLEAGEVEQLAFFLREFFDDFTIVCHLQRQDRLLEEAYTSLLVWGEAGDISDFFQQDGQNLNLDYADILARWTAVFGDGAVKPWVYDPGIPGSVDAPGMMLSLLGVTDGNSFSLPQRRVPSISRAGQSILKELNEALAALPEPLDRTGRRFLFASLQQSYQGEGYQPDPSARLAVMDHYADANETLRQTWFPERSQLFGPIDSSDTGDSVMAPAEPRALLRLFADVVVLSAKNERQLESEKSFLEGLLHLREKAQQKAERRFRMALSSDRRHIRARINLAKLLIDGGKTEQADSVLDVPESDVSGATQTELDRLDRLRTKQMRLKRSSAKAAQASAKGN
ncbi:MAG: hypothetical protein AAFY02_17415 [Pseudomonadota bacterium]